MADYQSVTNSLPAQASYQVGLSGRLAPLFTLWIAGTTYVTCRAIAVIRQSYVGGILWPFMSDTGRDMPACLVFVVGMWATSITSTWSFFTVYRRMKCWLNNARVQAASSLPISTLLPASGLALGASAAVFLVLLAGFGISSYPRVHRMAADAFFAAHVLSMTCWTVVFVQLHCMYPGNDQLASSTRIKVVTCILCLVAFTIYIPIGLCFECPARRLSMEDCLAITALSNGYCGGNVLPEDPSLTVLWTYQDCPRVYTMRAVAQTVCILFMLVFTSTFSMDLHPSLELLEAHHGYRLRVACQGGEARYLMSL